MPSLFRHRSAWLLRTSFLLSAIAGCSRSVGSFSTSVEPIAIPSPAIAASPAPTDLATAPSPIAEAPPDPYSLAINRASSAFALSQSAHSRDDWRLSATRWQQAIDLMQTVPSSSDRHAEAQTKLGDYRRNLAYAQQQANRPTLSPNAGGRVVIAAPAPPRPSPVAPVAAPAALGDRVYLAPIVRRAGGTPVIRATFNGTQSFDMIVDTGASGTVITPDMAAALNVVPVAQARVDTASARSVTFPLGYVSSVEVGGAAAQNLLVAVAGAELSIGLLGQDFFGSYDITVRQNVVEFRER